MKTKIRKYRLWTYGTYYAEATSNGRPIGELCEEERAQS